MGDDDFDEYEDKIRDVDEVLGTDVKINPDFYIHNAILKAQQALINPDMNSGFIQFRFMVENIEIMCKAAGMITDEYGVAITAFKQTEQFMKAESELIKHVILANKKMELLLEQVFAHKVSTTPMKG
jgi:hypothetical protein